MKFSHAGQIGDIIASFWLVRALTTDPVDFCIVTEQKSPYAIPDDTWHNGSMITRKSAYALAPLLRAQPWIRSVEIREEYPADSLRLDLWRRFPLNLAAGDLREFPFQTVPAVLPREFWKPVLQAEKSS